MATADPAPEPAPVAPPQANGPDALKVLSQKLDDFDFNKPCSRKGVAEEARSSGAVR